MFARAAPDVVGAAPTRRSFIAVTRQPCCYRLSRAYQNANTSSALMDEKMSNALDYNVHLADSMTMRVSPESPLQLKI